MRNQQTRHPPRLHRSMTSRTAYSHRFWPPSMSEPSVEIIVQGQPKRKVGNVRALAEQRVSGERDSAMQAWFSLVHDVIDASMTARFSSRTRTTAVMSRNTIFLENEIYR
ncbi:hypothetical protein J6590_069720 [Homalodisca vitripennis]|nr:hypothetical protein J6590_069720 [Homalodisca vitripennis]